MPITQLINAQNARLCVFLTCYNTACLHLRFNVIDATGANTLFINGLQSLVIAGLSIALAVSMMYFPGSAGGVQLDESWPQALNHFFTHRFQAGKDFIYTYGPLGTFTGGSYDRSLYLQRYLWELALKSSFALCLLLLIREAKSFFVRAGFLLSLALVLPAAHPDVFHLIFALTLGLLVSRIDKFNASYLPLLTLLVFISLTKFTYALLVLALLIVCEYAWRKRQPRSLFSPLITCSLVFVFAWMICDQSLWNLPQYIRSSLEVAGGYNAAMARDGDPREIALALFFLLLVFAILIFQRLKKNGTYHTETVLLILVALFFAWKIGFVRQDSHSHIFFYSAWFIAGLLPVLSFTRNQASSGNKSLVWIGMALCLLAALTGILNFQWPFKSRMLRNNFVVASLHKLQYTFRGLIDPRGWQAYVEPLQKNVEDAYGLPAIRNIVLARSIDVFSYEQGAALLNHLTWQPRPVFQGHLAYTPLLLEANAKFMRSSRAPEYLLFKLQSIDDRFPTLDDNQALLEIFRRYVPVASDRRYLLFKRLQNHPDQPLTPDATIRKQIGFTEEFKIPTTPYKHLLLHLEIEDSWMGKLRKMLYKPVSIFLEVRTSWGEKATYRIIPGMTKQGFLLSPLVRSTEDVLIVFRDHRWDDVKSLRIVTDSPHSYAKHIALEIRYYNRIATSMVPVGQIEDLKKGLSNH